ncbi:MAG: PilZ domain-containing protein [Calditerrivibrio sp.]|nr:PilZ domain-containing protein [Calditerrivibrio sp.]
MECKVIGCSYHKIEDDVSICSIYLLFDECKSTHIMMLNEFMFKKITEVRKKTTDFASRCATCVNYKCKFFNSDTNFFEAFSSTKINDHDNRKFNRIVTKLPCKILYKDKEFFGEIINLSIVGALVEIDSEHNILIDEDISIESYNKGTKLSINNTDIKHKNNNQNTLKGTVVWSLEKKVGLKFNDQLDFENIYNYINNYDNFISGNSLQKFNLSKSIPMIMTLQTIFPIIMI